MIRVLLTLISTSAFLLGSPSKKKALMSDSLQGHSPYKKAAKITELQYLIPSQKVALKAITKLKILSQKDSLSTAEQKLLELLKQQVKIYKFWETYFKQCVKIHQAQGVQRKSLILQLKYFAPHYKDLTKEEMPNIIEQAYENYDPEKEAPKSEPKNGANPEQYLQ